MLFSPVYVEQLQPKKNMTAVEILFTTKADMGWVGPTAYITGWPLLGLLIIITVCSLPFVRRGGHFEVSAILFIYCLVYRPHRLWTVDLTENCLKPCIHYLFSVIDVYLFISEKCIFWRCFNTSHCHTPDLDMISGMAFCENQTHL